MARSIASSIDDNGTAFRQFPLIWLETVCSG